MSKLITEEQKREIEKLATEHGEALIAYGADMYRRGIVSGACYAIAGAGVCALISLGSKLLKNHKNTEEE